MTKALTAVAIGAVLAAGGLAFWPRTEPVATAPVPGGAGEMVAVSMPALSGDEVIGKNVYSARCAACHGPNAGGIDGAGPPLVHVYYEPSHHADFAFHIAAEQGVRAHHWTFGDMPPVDGVTRAEVGAIVAFVRRVQRENGIF